MNDKKRAGWLGRITAKLTGQPSVSTPASAASGEEMAGPFTVVRVPGARALEEMRKLAEQGRGYPVLVGTQEDLDRVLENREIYAGQDDEDLLRKAEALDPLQWMRERVEGEPEHYEVMHAPWPEEVAPSNEFTGHCSIRTRKPYPEVIILLLQARHSWQVPCLLRYGNWNDCPEASAHAAMMRMWEKEYGARVVTVSGDVIEMSVERPPATREAALALARQQFIYCADIVDQGTQSLEALAATLLNGRVWYFWWD